MHHLKCGNWDCLKRLLTHLDQTRAGMPCKQPKDKVDRLFGELTHLSFVVDIGNTHSHERENP